MSILFDLDGVFYQSDQAIEGGAEVASWVKENNIAHLFITNTSSRPRNALIAKLASFGIQTDESHILTPAVATANWLKAQPPEKNYAEKNNAGKNNAGKKNAGKNNAGKNNAGKKIALFIPEATQIEFADFSLWHEDTDAIAAVIMGDLGEQWTFQRLNQAFRLLMQQPHPLFIALGMTRYWQASDGLRLDVAPFIVALEHATGIQAQVMGKPARAFYQSALDILGSQPEKTIMVGDDIQSDIAGAQAAGMQGVLVKTGKYRPEDLQHGIQPNAVLNSIRDLPDWWQHQSDLN